LSEKKNSKKPQNTLVALRTKKKCQIRLTGYATGRV